MAEDSSRVLIADDNKVNRLLLSRSVELLGHRVMLAENGRIALEKLQSEPFDLLLLDIEMPRMHGGESGKDHEGWRRVVSAIPATTITVPSNATARIGSPRTAHPNMVAQIGWRYATSAAGNDAARARRRR